MKNIENKTRSKEEIDALIKSIVIPKGVIKGNPMKELFKMKYGNEWKKYYPTRKDAKKKIHSH